MEQLIDTIILILVLIIAALALALTAMEAIDRFPWVQRLLAPNYHRGLDRELTPRQQKRYEKAAAAADRSAAKYDQAISREKSRRAAAGERRAAKQRHREHVARNSAAQLRLREQDVARAKS